MNPTDRITTLKEILSASLLVEGYDLEGLADWCKRSYPSLVRCREFKKQLLDAIQNPGLVSPNTYEQWTLDEDYPTQELLQDHFRNIWSQCFPNDLVSLH